MALPRMSIRNFLVRAKSALQANPSSRETLNIVVGNESAGTWPTQVNFSSLKLTCPPPRSRFPNLIITICISPIYNKTTLTLRLPPHPAPQHSSHRCRSTPGVHRAPRARKFGATPSHHTGRPGTRSTGPAYSMEPGGSQRPAGRSRREILGPCRRRYRPP